VSTERFWCRREPSAHSGHSLEFRPTSIYENSVLQAPLFSFFKRVQSEIHWLSSATCDSLTRLYGAPCSSTGNFLKFVGTFDPRLRRVLALWRRTLLSFP